ncbi:hypothetical protein ACT0SZ_001520 [Enterococcus faecalis]
MLKNISIEELIKIFLSVGAFVVSVISLIMAKKATEGQLKTEMEISNIEHWEKQKSKIIDLKSEYIANLKSIEIYSSNNLLEQKRLYGNSVGVTVSNEKESLDQYKALKADNLKEIKTIKDLFEEKKIANVRIIEELLPILKNSEIANKLERTQKEIDRNVDQIIYYNSNDEFLKNYLDGTKKLDASINKFSKIIDSYVRSEPNFDEK